MKNCLWMQLPICLFWKKNVLISGPAELLSLVEIFFYLLNCIKVVLHLSLLDKFKTQYCRKLIQSYLMPSNSIANGKYTSKFCWTTCVVFLVVNTAISVTPRVSCQIHSSFRSKLTASPLLEDCRVAILTASIC